MGFFPKQILNDICYRQLPAGAGEREHRRVVGQGNTLKTMVLLKSVHLRQGAGCPGRCDYMNHGNCLAHAGVSNRISNSVVMN